MPQKEVIDCVGHYHERTALEVDHNHRWLDYVEFYLTHHCNLTCVNCNRFSNHNLSGSADWNQHRDTYKEWSKKLHLEKVAFLGGEPTVYPQLVEVITDVHTWWPDAKLEITTNGLLINKLRPTVVDALIRTQTKLYVSIHYETWNESIKQAIESKFGTLRLKYTHRDTRDGPIRFERFVSASGNEVILEYTYYFRNSALMPGDSGKLELHHSDPESAHRVCDMKHSHHFWEGKLYKCGVMVTLPYMIEQKADKVNIHPDQQKLLDSYKPITVEDFYADPNSVINLENTIDQCTFCPANYTEYTKIITEDIR